jgi:hypothetical protein
VAPDLGSWHRLILHRDCHVKFNYSLYSAPFTLVGQTLWLRATDLTVAIFQDYRLVATHLRCRSPGGRRTCPDHLPPEARSFFAHDRHWCLQQATDIGPSCAALIDQLLTDRILERLRSAQNVLHLAETYGRQRLEAACARAMTHASPRIAPSRPSSPVASIDCRCRTTRQSDFVYGRDARFQRDAQTLFTFDLDAMTRPDTDRVESFFPVRKSLKEYLMNPIPELGSMLKQLRLSGILDSIEARNREAID